MNEVSVPVFPLDKEEEVVSKVLKLSALANKSKKEKKHSNKTYGCLDDVQLLLFGMGMEKYYSLFTKSNITLDTFVQLNETDLTELGITDRKDVEAIAKSLRGLEAKPKKLLMPGNPLHDLQIAKNVRDELVVLQNYCRYLELQMRKHKLTDYRINWKESASTYLKAFTEAASLQAKILSQRVFHDSGDNHLIGKILQLNNLTLSKELKEKLNCEKSSGKKGRRKKVCVAVILGMLSLAAVIKYFSQET